MEPSGSPGWYCQWTQRHDHGCIHPRRVLDPERRTTKKCNYKKRHRGFTLWHTGGSLPHASDLNQVHPNPAIAAILAIHHFTKEKIETILQDAETQREKILSKARTQAEEKVKKTLKQAKIKFDTELLRYGANMTLKEKQRVLHKKEIMIKEVLDAAFEQIRKKTSLKQYKKILTRLAVDGILTLDAEEAVLVFSKGQQSIVTSNELTKLVKAKTKGNVKITISKETIDATGGVMIKSVDGKRWVNNTFENRFERLEREIRDETAKILFVGKRW